MFNFNELQQKAYESIISGHNTCITGPGGTGKSYVIQQIRESIKDETIFVAPTGIAAVNRRAVLFKDSNSIEAQLLLPCRLKDVEKLYSELRMVVLLTGITVPVQDVRVKEHLH